MWPWLIIPIVLGALLVIFIAVILIRAFMFKPLNVENKTSHPVFVNGEKAVHDLAEMIKCKTISHRDASLDDEAEFLKFEKLLPELFVT